MLAGALVKISLPYLKRVFSETTDLSIAVQARELSSLTNNFMILINAGRVALLAVASVASILAKSSATFSLRSI
jgi:hypothetical protein